MRRSSSRVFAALEEFGAEPDQINPRRDLRVARHRLARPRRARADRRGRVRRAAQGRGHGGREDRPSGRRPGDVEAGMTRSRRHHRRRRGHAARRGRPHAARALERGVSGIEDGFGRATSSSPRSTSPSKEVRRSDRFTQLALAAAAEALEDAGWDGEPARRPGPRGLRDRHRDRRHRHAGGAPHHPARARAPTASRRCRSRC